MIEDTLFQWSIEHVKWTRTVSPNLTLVFHWISEIADKYGMFLLFTIAFCSCSGVTGYAILMCVLSNVIVNITLKLYLKDPRPYYIDSTVHPTKCTLDYGNPSGHSQVSISFNLLLWSIYCNAPKKKISAIKKYSLLVVAILISGIVGYSRLYIVSHTLDQILYGYVVGVLMFFFFMEIWEDIEKHYASMPGMT